MLRSILILVALIFAPWGLSALGTSLGFRVFPGPLLSPWVKRDAGEVAVNPDVPPFDWLEAVYLARYPDVAQAVKKGALRSGYHHYALFGRTEGREGAFATFPAPSAPVSSTTAAPLPVPPPSAAPPSAVLPPVDAPAPMPAPPIPSASAAPASPPVAPPRLPGRKPAMSRGVDAPAPLPAGSRATPESAVAVSSIRAGIHNGFTRIVLEMNGPMAMGKRAQRDQHSLDVELPNAVWQPARQGQLLTKILRYRIEDSPGGNSRLRIDSDKAIRLKSLFALPADGGRGHRLILDVASGP